MFEGISDDEYVELISSVGTHKRNRPLKPGQVCDLLGRLRKNYNIEQIKEILNLNDATVINDFLSLSDLPNGYRALVDWGSPDGKLSFSTAAKLSRVRDPQLRTALAEKILQHRLTKTEAITVLQRVRRGRISLNDAISEILKLRPTVEYNHVYMGRLKDISVTRGLAQQRLRKGLAARVGAKNLISVAVSNDTYVFVLSDEGRKTLLNKSSMANQFNAANMDATVKEIVENE